jgi:hypothetical protein
MGKDVDVAEVMAERYRKTGRDANDANRLRIISELRNDPLFYLRQYLLLRMIVVIFRNNPQILQTP